MREIKFRGWNVRLKRMNTNSQEVLAVMADPELSRNIPLDFIIMQYTGL